MKKGIFDKEVLNEMSEKLIAAWREAPGTEPDFLEDYPLEARQEKERQIRHMVEKGKEGLGEYPASFFAVRKRKKWKKRMEGMLEEALWKEPLLDMAGAMEREQLLEFRTCLKEFLQKVRKFDKSLDFEDMGQAARNYMVYAIFLVLNGRALHYRPAAFGYSMLYPYTDNFIDAPDRTKEEKERYNRLIKKKLMGEPVRPLSRHERKTAQLLGQVEADYGRPHEVYKGLLLMLEAQVKSLKQEERWRLRQEAGGQGTAAPLEAEAAALEVSVYKGGVSVLTDRYFIDVPFTERDMYFYYGFGFLLQLCDDLQDIAQDKAEGNPTVFSLCRTQEEASWKVNKLLHFARSLFAACDAKKEGFRDFLQKNCYLLILASAAGSREWMEESWLTGMERRLPVSLEYLHGYGGNLLGNGKKGEKGIKEKKERQRLLGMLDVLLAD